MRGFAFALLALIGATAAAASADVSGAWSFKTDPFDGGCVMTGTLQVDRAAKNGVHACTLSTQEKCPGARGGAIQSCTFNEKNGAVTITSKIVRQTGDARWKYYADDFSLKVESSARMSGQLHSDGGGGPVVFFRGPALTS